MHLEKPIVIVGMGISGQAILNLLIAMGISRDQIFTHDQKTNSDLPTPQDVINLKPKTLVVSPGVPLSTPWIQDLLRGGCELTSELEIAYQHLTHEKVVGITGSVGKSTVTSLLGAGLAAAGKASFVGGNLGQPLASYVLQKLTEGAGSCAEYTVLELSSYQLENFPSLRCHSCLLTSLTPNHMERYESLQQYYDTKFKLLQVTSGAKILNQNGLELAHYQTTLKDPRTFWVQARSPELQTVPFDQMNMVGSHNRDNLAMAWKWGLIHQMPDHFFQGLLKFAGLAHRLESLGEVDGILYLNDSKATTIASVIQAVESVKDLAKTRAQTWLLLGGRNKNLPWSDLQPFAQLTFKFVFFGECGALAQNQSGLQGPIFENLKTALDFVKSQTQPNDLVILSPGGTSLDEFKSFEDRGDYFRKRILQ